MLLLQAGLDFFHRFELVAGRRRERALYSSIMIVVARIITPNPSGYFNARALVMPWF